MHKIRFCHSRGIQCLVRFVWDVNVANGAGKGAEDPTVTSITKAHKRSAMQILLWTQRHAHTSTQIIEGAIST